MNLKYTHSTFMVSLACLGLLSSCQKEAFLSQEAHAQNESAVPLPETTKGVAPNMLRVRFDLATAEKLGLNDSTAGSGVLRSAGAGHQLDVYMREAGIEKMTRLFPANPKYPKSMHEMGLDRWYDITFKEDEPVVCAHPATGIEICRVQRSSKRFASFRSRINVSLPISQCSELRMLPGIHLMTPCSNHSGG